MSGKDYSVRIFIYEQSSLQILIIETLSSLFLRAFLLQLGRILKSKSDDKYIEVLLLSLSNLVWWLDT